MQYEEVDGVRAYTFKVLVVGDIGTGKTSFVKRVKYNTFSEKVPPTAGADFLVTRLKINPVTEVQVQLWDIAGQERFGNLTRVYFRDAVGAFVLFDVTRRNTFDGAKRWKQDIDKLVSFQDKPIPTILLANKCDLEGESFLAKNTLGFDRFINEYSFIGWLPTSAKQGLNIDKALSTLIGSILDTFTAAEATTKPAAPTQIKDLSKQTPPPPEAGCCT